MRTRVRPHARASWQLSVICCACGAPPLLPGERLTPEVTVMSEQDHKVVIVTGGSRGIGAGVVAEYRRRGWAVVAASRTIEPAGDPAVLTVEGDISDPATADRIISGALERFGRIDTLINNAGVFISKPFTDYTADDYALVVGVNLTGFFRADPARHQPRCSSEAAATSSTSPPRWLTTPTPERPRS